MEPLPQINHDLEDEEDEVPEVRAVVALSAIWSSIPPDKEDCCNCFSPVLLWSEMAWVTFPAVADALDDNDGDGDNVVDCGSVSKPCSLCACSRSC